MVRKFLARLERALPGIVMATAELVAVAAVTAILFFLMGLLIGIWLTFRE